MDNLKIKVGEVFYDEVYKDTIKIIEIENKTIRVEVLEDPEGYWDENLSTEFPYSDFKNHYTKHLKGYNTKLYRILNNLE